MSCVTNIYYMFYDQYYIRSYAGLDKWDTSRVTNMAYAFSYNGFKVDGDCDGFTGIENWDTSSVTSLAYMLTEDGGPARLGCFQSDQHVAHVLQ